MGSEIFHEFKRQASYFFTEKIKTARLVLTDVTPAELMTEEATKGNTGPPDIRTMGVISRAAFEVDDYWRIVEILHKRFFKFDRTNWRDFYKALILLEHLLTHGPRRVAEEFQCDKDVIKEIGNFQYIDERGVLKLLESETLLKEERARARKLTHGIEGFGSFSQRSSSKDAIMKDSSFQRFGRSNSHCNEDQNPENESLVSSESLIKQGD
ncbi:epsin-2 [Quercus suber]|uniref:Epsin-2 n=1 Tax=Quercus suber TaxID=58331 RepID=A0AAW0M6H1_QUESU